MLEQPGDRPQRQLVLLAALRGEGRVAVPPQRDVQVRRASRVFGERFGHEAGDLAVSAGHLFGRVLEPGGIVGGLQGIGVDQVRLDLPRAVLGFDPLQPGEGGKSLLQIGEQRIEGVRVLQ